jgi:hypothetical protein
MLTVLPLLGLATGGAVYMASNTVQPTYAGVSKFTVHCTVTPTLACITTAAPQSP